MARAADRSYLFARTVSTNPVRFGHTGGRRVVALALRLFQGNVRRGRRRIGHSVSCSVGDLRLSQWLVCRPFVMGFHYEASARQISAEIKGQRSSSGLRELRDELV